MESPNYVKCSYLFPWLDLPVSTESLFWDMGHVVIRIHKAAGEIFLDLRQLPLHALDGAGRELVLVFLQVWKISID